ncbi:MAG: hypothetical protein GSR84_00065 [Desulfurococcales archaeon]|nr:hypothetical protein [Desulfurococcales archaeon]
MKRRHVNKGMAEQAPEYSIVLEQDPLGGYSGIQTTVTHSDGESEAKEENYTIEVSIIIPWAAAL